MNDTNTPAEGQPFAHPEPPKGSTVKIVLIVVGAVVLLTLLVCGGLIAILIPALNKSRDIALQLQSATQARQIHQALMIYSTTNDDKYPPADNWQQLLIDADFLSPDDFVSPVEDGDGVSYIYVYTPGMSATYAADRIILYEDTDHFPGGVNVVFDDGHTEFIPHAGFQAMLADQQAQDTDATPEPTTPAP